MDGYELELDNHTCTGDHYDYTSWIAQSSVQCVAKCIENFSKEKRVTSLYIQSVYAYFMYSHFQIIACVTWFIYHAVTKASNLSYRRL